MAKTKPQHKVRNYTGKPKGQIANDQILFYGGIFALVGVGVGAYFWMASIQAAQQQQQLINSATKTAQPLAQSTALAGVPVMPAVLPGTAAVTVGAVNPMGAFHTIFPYFGGSTFFTLTRRSCDPFLGGVPTQADLASQGIIITSYQVNNIGGPVPPAVCGLPIMSITVGVTDPASGVKLQAMGFLPGTYGGGFLGGLWPKPLGPSPVFPPTAMPHQTPIPIPLPPQGVPPLKIPGLWTIPHHRRGRHHRDHRDHRDKVHFIGLPKHNFIKPIGHVINFQTN